MSLRIGKWQLDPASGEVTDGTDTRRLTPKSTAVLCALAVRPGEWAPLMESRIRMAFAADPALRIRSLACRSSVCAVEAEGSRVLSPIWDHIHSDLLLEDKIYAFENVDNGGERLLVSLLVFERRR